MDLLDDEEGSYPSVQVWHPTSPTEYTRVDTECALTASDISMMRDNGDEYYLGNVSCTGNNRIEFQSNDIIGYYHGDPLRYTLWTIVTNGHTVHRRTDRSNPLNIFNTGNADDTFNDRQPLVQIMYGKIKCTYILLANVSFNMNFSIQDICFVLRLQIAKAIILQLAICHLTK